MRKIHSFLIFCFFFLRHAWEIKKEWIICTPGIIAAFYSAIRAYTDPGDGVLYMGPVYYPFMKSIKNTKHKAYQQFFDP